MKFTVGYPIKKTAGFIDELIKNKEHINEIYFSVGDVAHGRGFSGDDEVESEPLRYARLTADLERLHKAGIRLDLLLNGNCYGDDALSRDLFTRIGNTVDSLASLYELRTVTTTSPLIGKFIHQNFDGMDVRASVNMGIGNVAAFDYISEYFDSFYLKREYNRDIKKLTAAKAWCDKNGKRLHLLANSGCLNDCSAHTFHDNLVAHEAEIKKRDNAYVFSGICRDYLKDPAKAASIVRDCSYIRPEDVPLYDGMAEAMKLATRVSPNPARILNAYINGSYRGAVTDLLEPDNGSALHPAIVDNSRFPKDFGERVRTCNKDCVDCGYCECVYSNARVDLSSDNWF